MFAVGSLFVFSCVGIIGLFVLKKWEITQDRILFEGARERLDRVALRLKVFLEARMKDIEQLLPHSARFLRILVHAAAIGFGHLAHWVGERSHALADLVSHKHRFERKTSRSEYLQRVSEHKNGNSRTVESEE